MGFQAGNLLTQFRFELFAFGKRLVQLMAGFVQLILQLPLTLFQVHAGLLQLISMIFEALNLFLQLLNMGLHPCDLISRLRLALLVVPCRLGQSILHHPEFLTLILQSLFQVSACLLPFMPLLLESVDLFL